jgi:hypothetical protein
MSVGSGHAAAWLGENGRLWPLPFSWLRGLAGAALAIGAAAASILLRQSLHHLDVGLAVAEPCIELARAAGCRPRREGRQLVRMAGLEVAILRDSDVEADGAGPKAGGLSLESLERGSTVAFAAMGLVNADIENEETGTCLRGLDTIPKMADLFSRRLCDDGADVVPLRV